MKRSTPTRWIVTALTAAAIAAPTAQASDVLGQYSNDGPRSGPTAAQLQQFTTDGPRSGPAVVTLPQAPTAAGNGFDWADAGIGAGLGAAFGLLFAGGALVIVRRHRDLAGV